MNVYIVVIVSRGQDERIGAVYRSHQQAEEECKRLIESSLEINDAYWVGRVLENE